MVFIYSNLAQDVNIVNWGKPGANGVPVKEFSKIIKGGVGVINSKTMTQPAGAVMTEVTDKELEQMRQNAVFQSYEQSGFIWVGKTEDKSLKKTVSAMEKDKTGQLTAKDFKNPPHMNNQTDTLDAAHL